MRRVRPFTRFRCDYCRKTGGARSITRHERVCYKNPNRFCPLCENDKNGIWVAGDGRTEPAYYMPCDACEISKRLLLTAVQPEG